MIYGDLTNAIYSLNTGNIPDNIAFVTKLICGKITRKRIADRVKIAEISTNGSLVINLRTALPDFFDFKTNPNDEGKNIKCFDSSNQPYFFKIASPTQFDMYTSGGYAKKEGRTLTLKIDDGGTIPDKIYFPYYSFYAWTDVVTGLEKEIPDNNDDECLLPSVFDDVIVDGILLYISRREKESSEYTKNVTEWEKRVNEVIFYS